MDFQNEFKCKNNVETVDKSRSRNRNKEPENGNLSQQCTGGGVSRKDIMPCNVYYIEVLSKSIETLKLAIQNDTIDRPNLRRFHL